MGYRENYFAAEEAARNQLMTDIEKISTTLAEEVETANRKYNLDYTRIYELFHKNSAKRFEQYQADSAKEMTTLIAESNASVGLNPSGAPLKKASLVTAK